MFLVAGLGNPGIAYALSRHNAGFFALDALSEKLNIRVHKRAHRSLLGEGVYQNQKVLLCKPQTYMNLSGEAISAILSYYKIPVEQLIVLYDDIDLPLGALRIRARGGAGTHNGMRSILACLGGDENFPRIRIGMGRQRPGGDLANFVLGKPSKEEQARLKQTYEDAAEAALLIITGKLMEAQANYNQIRKAEEE